MGEKTLRSLFKEKFMEVYKQEMWEDMSLNFHFRFKDSTDGYYTLICDVDIIEDYQCHLRLRFGIDEENYICLIRLNNCSFVSNGTVEDVVINLLPNFIGETL